MKPKPTDQSREPVAHVARARERFLSEDGVVDDRLTGAVRDAISTSWRRSRSFKVQTDRLELPFVREPNTDSPLMTAARPVLDQLATDLSSEPVSIILTSPDGVVLSRAAGSGELLGQLDAVSLAPGYSYSEEHAGTNGIGTALETRQATLVTGAEHYAGCLAQLSCAGVPIRNPFSGGVVGALDLTGWVEKGGSLLLSLAKSATVQIEQQMLANASESESRLLSAYLATCRRAPQMMVLAIAADVVLMNRRLRQSIDPQDQVSMLEHAVDQTLDVAAGRRVNTLPSGRSVRLAPVVEFSDAAAGIAVFHVHLMDSATATSPQRRPSTASMLPGIVGRSSSWRQASDRIAQHVGAGHWIAVSGERGSGRSAVLRAAAGQCRHGTIRVYAAADFQDTDTLDSFAAELDTDGFAIILRDADEFDDDMLFDVAEVMQGREHAGWLGMTLSAGDATPTLGVTLLPFFSHTIEVPPLRHRIEDLQVLVPAILLQLTRGRELEVAPDAMRQLSKYTWPGNVAELRQALRDVVIHHRSGTITAQHLPPTYRAQSRHTLTRIEALERDAIVRSLEENGRNKVAAAHALGISRATIYRKIKEFGIDV
ncbi:MULTISPECIES: sigma-54-dependent Fis family transcriptional regulator [Gordonia]|uniref:sigma-54-dependent Fis family transcriptional regulator n=1 Tax=Gordonia TaxID=2053 RepID=UPI0004B83837|nr:MULTISPECIES: helix-turn-helix domain-containing protein [Gordonia]KAF0970110.1 Acetoin dehydrogenase operon transcriptional activator AcoR [Gordonia sp. YY1]MDH3007404.1 helix-turn-helix domain-containing protein [Gordonia alkanivorans]MDH3025705.1 helix-turn-helix domain-containing protein [Gordonia alkanivorans]MDH3050249.1 helix-turn-helix domain-containing protein [Gordonia alkanivorans]MDJ0007964.1 helix-turn-helix domain-containing protein [Gordonia alkanivorans]